MQFYTTDVNQETMCKHKLVYQLCVDEGNGTP